MSERYSSEEQYYQDYNQPNIATYDNEDRLANRTRLMTVVLIAAVAACSCLSCLIGAGLGILF